MSHAELDRLEGDVCDARRRLKSNLEVLRAPETFSSFKEEVLDEARQSRDDIVANVKEAATDRVERFVADIKERAAANPVAVGAIAAGVAWRILRKPPITTMLVGYGLISLWRTKPGQPAPGAETVSPTSALQRWTVSVTAGTTTSVARAMASPAQSPIARLALSPRWPYPPPGRPSRHPAPVGRASSAIG